MTPASAQELTRIVTAPQDGTILGEIGDVDLGPDGRVLVLDTQANIVFVYDEEGLLVGELGGEGQGPGEIMLSVEVEVGPNGEVVVADARNLRLTMWDAQSHLATSTRFDELFGSGPAWPHDLVWSRAGLFLKISRFMPDRPFHVFRIPDGMEGAAERVVVVAPGDAAATCPFCPITVDDSGRVLAAAGDTLYSVRVLGVEGEAVQQWVRTDLPAVRRTAAELERLAEAGRGLAASVGLSASSVPAVSEFKTRFGPHALGVDGRGRLWTAPRVVEGEPGALDVFAPDGTFLATLPLDVPLKAFRIRGDRLVISSESPMGEPVVHVFRIDG